MIETTARSAGQRVVASRAMAETRAFDPGAAAGPDSGIFGLPHSVEQARVIVVPVPFAATTSYGGGAESGPDAVLRASRQVDLFDIETGRPYEAGIAMLDDPATRERLLSWHRDARTRASTVIEHGGRIEGDDALQAALREVNAICRDVNTVVYDQVRELLARGKLVALVGGDHAVPFGSIRAHAEAHPGVGVLHIDAHADLRVAFEGFEFSHASIMHNVLEHVPGVARLVQVGIRDLSEDEFDTIARSDGRVRTHYDADLARRRFDGVPWSDQVRAIVQDLPERVYVSFDIDGLDPTLCPHTGTPVPGGLSFHEASYLIGAVARSGRRIVGVDLNEVVDADDEWDGNVGARVLYKMIGWMLVSHAFCAPPVR
jgi:agmatinase